MTEYARHHRASREIIVVPVPYEIGSPKHGREVKPPAYRHDQHQPWRPATRPPNKAEKFARFLDRIRKQEQDIRAFMAEARRQAA